MENANTCSNLANYRYGGHTWPGETICFLSDCYPCRAKALAWEAAYEQERQEEKGWPIDDKISGDSSEEALRW